VLQQANKFAENAMGGPTGSRIPGLGSPWGGDKNYFNPGPLAPWMHNDTHLSYYPGTKVSSLANGLRIATEERDGTGVATVGVWINTGTRYEDEKSNGVAHFLEHMIFKGTKQRSRLDLEVGIEDMGGHLNAYTSREQTVFYAQCFKNDVGKSLDILADILQNSEYTDEAIQVERSCILQEFESVNNQPEEVVFDRLHETAYRGLSGARESQALGKTILGTVENIKSITREDIADYIGTHYTPDRMVIAASGDIKHDEVVKLCEKLFGGMKKANKTGKDVDVVPAVFTGSSLTVRNDDDKLAHIAYAFPTGGWTDDDHFVLAVIQPLLGVWSKGCTSGVHSMSSLVRAAAMDDLCEQFTTFHTIYNDTGLFGIHAVCENTTIQDFMWHVTQNFQRLSTETISDERLAAAKNVVKFGTASVCDNTTTSCEDIGRQMLTFGRRLHPVEIAQRIDAVDAAAIQNCANRFFWDHDFALAAVGPIHELPDYNWLRRRTYSLKS
jgi:processing peptidase subunit beta